LTKNLEFFEIDPLLNEIDYITYKYIPSVAVIKNTNWEYKIFHKKLTTAKIVQFIKSNTNIENDEKILH
jgi:hypothetical protein